MVYEVLNQSTGEYPRPTKSSSVSKDQLSKDPRNKYLARFPRVRLTPEQIRDQALRASGLLSEKMYGPSVMPYQPDGIWQTVYSGQNGKRAKTESNIAVLFIPIGKEPAPSLL